jgi:hypothetical protein
MEIGEIYLGPDGLWCLPVHDARASTLIVALDPAEPFVVVEGHAPARGDWLELPVPITADPASVGTRTVRRLRFDLLLTPEEVRRIGVQWDRAEDGGLYLWQSSKRPPTDTRLLDKDGTSWVSAVRGLGVSLVIQLPHRGETAKLSATDEQRLEAARLRIESGTQLPGGAS